MVTAQDRVAQGHSRGADFDNHSYQIQGETGYRQRFRSLIHLRTDRTPAILNAGMVSVRVLWLYLIRKKQSILISGQFSWRFAYSTISPSNLGNCSYLAGPWRHSDTLPCGEGAGESGTQYGSGIPPQRFNGGNGFTPSGLSLRPWLSSRIRIEEDVELLSEEVILNWLLNERKAVAG